MTKKLTRIKCLENTVIVLRELVTTMNVAMNNLTERITTLEMDSITVLREPPKPKITYHRRKIVSKLNKEI